MVGGLNHNHVAGKVGAKQQRDGLDLVRLLGLATTKQVLQSVTMRCEHEL